jgi:hypothetical protein
VCDYTNIAAKDNLKNKEIQVKGWEMELDDHVDGVRIRLWPPTGLVVYEHGKPWWNNIDRGNS